MYEDLVVKDSDKKRNDKFCVLIWEIGKAEVEKTAGMKKVIIGENGKIKI